MRRLSLLAPLTLSGCAVVWFNGQQRLPCDGYRTLSITDAQLFVQPLADADFEPTQVGLGSANCIAQISHDFGGPKSSTTVDTSGDDMVLANAEMVSVYTTGSMAYSATWTPAFDTPYIDTPSFRAQGFNEGGVLLDLEGSRLIADVPGGHAELPEPETFSMDWLDTATLTAADLRAAYMPNSLTALVSGELVSLGADPIIAASIAGSGADAVRLAVEVDADTIVDLDIEAQNTPAEVMMRAGDGPFTSLGTLDITADGDITVWLPPGTYDFTTTGTVSAQDTTIVDSATGAVGAINLSAPNGLIRIFDRDQYGGNWPP